MTFDLKNFFHPKEKFLLLEISPKKTKSFLLGLDRDKKITVLKPWSDFDLKSLTSPLKKLTRRQLVVVADPALAAVLESPAKIRRDSNLAGRPITTTELDNMLSQAIDKSFGHLRKIASAKFKTDEIDTILVGIEARSFTIDGHSIFNPIGFSGKSLDLVLEFIFTVRYIFEELKDYFSARNGFFFGSSVNSIVNTISRLHKPANFLVLRPERTTFTFRNTNEGVIREEVLDWSFADFLEAIASQVQIKEEPGNGSFLGGSFLLDGNKTLQQIVKRHLKSLAKEINEISKSRKVHIRILESLPLVLPRKEYTTTFDYLPLKPVLERFGFSIDSSSLSLSEDELFVTLAPFFEFYHNKGNSEINNVLRRKINWLVR